MHTFSFLNISGGVCVSLSRYRGFLLGSRRELSENFREKGGTIQVSAGRRNVCTLEGRLAFTALSV